MQELFQLIKERFQKVRKLCNQNLAEEEYKQLREEEKLRCEKECWILSMFRNKKNLTSYNKQCYFKYSSSIMEVIEPTFQYQVNPTLSDSTFLNDFVCLYTHFFDQYENKFNFKIKIRNLLRPTNHNVINDLIKYLADFSRDYSQHLYVWKIKRLRQIEQSRTKSFQMDQQFPIEEKKKNINLQKPQKQILNVKVQTSSLSQQQTDNQLPAKKQKQFQRLYGCLDLQWNSNFVFADKSKLNVDVLKLKLNQIFRDNKWRNNFIKKLQMEYYSSYRPKLIPNYNQQFISEQIYLSVPIRLSLSFQKNGFSCLNILTNFSQGKNNREPRELSPIKEKTRASSFAQRDSVQSQQLRGRHSTNDLMLNSLKVLRVSENFLPPLSGQSTPRTLQDSKKRQSTKVSLQKNATPPTPPKNYENLINPKIGEIKEEIYKKDGVIYYNQEFLREAERKKNQKKRINDMRKHFISEERMKNKKQLNNPQEKIGEWLDKINLMKQIERRKIMGLG